MSYEEIKTNSQMSRSPKYANFHDLTMHCYWFDCIILITNQNAETKINQSQFEGRSHKIVMSYSLKQKMEKS